MHFFESARERIVWIWPERVNWCKVVCLKSVLVADGTDAFWCLWALLPWPEGEFHWMTSTTAACTGTGGSLKVQSIFDTWHSCSHGWMLFKPFWCLVLVHAVFSWLDLIQNDSNEFVTSECWRRISSCKIRVLGISVLTRVISRTHHCRGFFSAMKFSTGKRKEERQVTSRQCGIDYYF